LLGYNTIINKQDNILDEKFILANKDLNSYFNLTKEIKPYKLQNYHLEEPEMYLNKGYKEGEDCTVLDNFEFTYLIIALCAPVLYFLTACCLVVIYCKYRTVRHNYEQLQNEQEDDRNSDPNIQTNDNDINNGLELGQVNN
jgi:hypothetical protein